MFLYRVAGSGHELLLMLELFLSAFLRDSHLHFQNSGIEEAMGGSSASAFVRQLLRGSAHSRRVSELSFQVLGVPEG